MTAAFEEFLRSFKSSTSEAEDALEDLALEDGDSEEYDFMDDAEDGATAPGTRRQRRQRRSKQKYMQMLQDVADRKRTNVVVDLDDLDQVQVMCTALHGVD